MLEKKRNPNVLKVVSKLERLLKGKINCTDTNIEGRDFYICKNLSKIWDSDKNYVSVCICGGLNGWGKWSNYFKSLSELMEIIENAWEDSFILKVDYDASDDLFYAQVIIKLK